MPKYAALIYHADVDWSAPEHAEEIAEYGEFGQAAGAVIRGDARGVDGRDDRGPARHRLRRMTARR